MLRNKRRLCLYRCLGLFFLLSGCGLPKIAYLYPPALMTVSGSQFSVKNNPLNFDPAEGGSQTYKGIEIFYRIFPTETAAGDMRTALAGERNIYDGRPAAFMDRVQSTHKFLRLRAAAGSTKPLVTIAANDEKLYTVATSDWKLRDDADIVLADVQRNLESNPNASSAVFADRQFRKGDPDYAGETTNGTVYIVLFAVSYGIDQSTVGQEVYSMPYIPSNYLTY